jgi:hypothetical protein
MQLLLPAAALLLAKPAPSPGFQHVLTGAQHYKWKLCCNTEVKTT